MYFHWWICKEIVVTLNYYMLTSLAPLLIHRKNALNIQRLIFHKSKKKDKQQILRIFVEIIFSDCEHYNHLIWKVPIHIIYVIPQSYPGSTQSSTDINCLH